MQLTQENLRKFLEYYGIEAELVEFNESVVRSSDASQQVKDGVVIKSVVLMVDGEIVIAVLRGCDRVNLERVAELLKAREVRLARAKEVKEEVGYDVGGVPPFGHIKRFLTLVDKKVEELRDSLLYAGGGSHRHLLKLRGDALFDALKRTNTEYMVASLAE